MNVYIQKMCIFLHIMHHHHCGGNLTSVLETQFQYEVFENHLPVCYMVLRQLNGSVYCIVVYYMHYVDYMHYMYYVYYMHYV